MEKKTKINDEKLLKKLGVKPHEGQRAVIEAFADEKKRDFVLVWGRRGGKSFIVSYCAIRQIIIPNKKVWIVAPTTDLTQKVFTYVIQFVGKLYEPGEYQLITKPYPKIKFANGSLIECKTADNPTSLIGDEVDLLIIDEASRIAPMTYERELAATTMTRKGRTVFISTPRGKNWFYLKYQQIKSNKDGFVYTAPSSINKLNTPEELERIKNTIPEFRSV